MQLSEADHARISAAIAQSETRTSAEIVCVISAAASEYRFTPVLWASVFALMLPWPLWWFTQIEISRVLLAQMGLFAALLFVFSSRWLRLFLTPRSIRRADVERAAERQFAALGISRTERRAGVLIYVSVGERIAIILPDSMARAVLTLDDSQKALSVLMTELKRKKPADGFMAAIELLTNVLAIKLPAVAGERNELTDQVLEI